MALFNRFSKKLKGENKYFSQRKSDTPEGSEAPVEVVKQEYCLSCDYLINKDLIADVFKLLRNHDGKAAVALFSNTTDNTLRQTARMINKGYVPQKIVGYLQNVSIREIERAMQITRDQQPDSDGFLPIDEQTAARLNLPLGCMILGIVHHLKKDFGMILVMKTSMKDKAEFKKKLLKRIRR